ncbi:MAG: phospholipid/cholesterol/gamma-HCH transport system substrate-binding protein [Thermoleophilaceae bacterium]|jgi:phospholipid/cholesterol/gamma-HCH transport system substrate-binding protein|nr:phospholipid/cholesterol/gamma-HCH transport system substrate-binding protein [Thermoleophilaceae bacterium]
MSGRITTTPRLAVALLLLVALGIAAAMFTLVNERAPVPFRDTYDVRAALVAADGVEPSLGQPVRVAGVQVGSISDLEIQGGRAIATLEILRDQVPVVYRDATVALKPITPLEDMQIELDPGDPPAAPLADGGLIGAQSTTSPVPISDLLSALDGDTRAFLSSLLESVSAGTEGEGPDLRRTLLTLGPTTEQLGRVSRALAQRRADLARLVHNLALVTRAASRDDELDDLVVSADQTLSALAQQDGPLREAVARLPRALSTTSAALDQAGAFAREMEPSLQSLLPAVRRLPDTLDAVRPLAATGTRELSHNVRPFVKETVPALDDLAPASKDLTAQLPDVVTGLRGLNYLLNELAYNPPGQKNGFDDEGLLYWASWWFHNYNSMFSAKDAHGGAARAMVMVNCQQIAGLVGIGELLKLLIGPYNLCPES